MNYSNATVRPASPKQIAFLDRLLEEKNAPAALLDDLDVARESGLSTRDASRFIDGLLASPRKQVVKSVVAKVDPGFYVVEGVIYKVQPSQSNPGRTYAKRLSLNVNEDGSVEAISWEYARGALSLIASHGRELTLEEAKGFGRTHGFCCICARLLTNEQSVEAGIGPVCASKF